MPAPPHTHTSKVYEHELRTLREKLLHMGSLVEEMIHQGTVALTTRDTNLARETIRTDRRINRLECEVDELAMRILATRQPVASDLRFITTALKIVTDLERIGDLCVNICERVVELNEEPPLPPVEDLGSLSEEVIAIVHEALDALVERDVERATALLSRDDVIDEHYSSIFKEVLSLMARDPSTVYRATRVQSVAKYLERISDHAMNIAEVVVFLVKGKDIRHWNRRTESDMPPAAADDEPDSAAGAVKGARVPAPAPTGVRRNS
ncbi:MAG TPA: phosphate signaling complex protein PhoU [Polyangiaceae bacterium]|nr:phosphate signaling complex protein PhoU [Polyangiaceae bacterium]